MRQFAVRLLCVLSVTVMFTGVAHAGPCEELAGKRLFATVRVPPSSNGGAYFGTYYFDFSNGVKGGTLVPTRGRRTAAAHAPTDVSVTWQ